MLLELELEIFGDNISTTLNFFVKEYLIVILGAVDVLQFDLVD